eukprot:467173_1
MPASFFINPSSSDLDQAGVVFDLSIFFRHKTQKVLKWIATFSYFLINYKVPTNANLPAILTHNSQPTLATRTCDRCCILGDCGCYPFLCRCCRQFTNIPLYILANASASAPSGIPSSS